MKENRLLMTVAVLTLPALLLAWPGIGGGKGLLRVQDARVSTEGIDLMLHLVGRHPTFLDGSARQGWVVDVPGAGLSYTPYSSKYFGAEVFAAAGGVFQHPEASSDSANGYPWGAEYIRPGAKLSIPWLPVLKVGGMVSYDYVFGAVDGIRLRLDPWASPASSTDPFNWAALGSLRFQDLHPSIPNLHFNYGKFAGRNLLGAGLEFDADMLGLAAEVRSLAPTTADFLDPARSDIRGSLGATFNIAKVLAITLGYSVGLGDNTPNEAMLGLTYATPFFRKQPPRLGNIAGIVTNKSNGAPLAATITFPESPKLAPTTSDPATGVFTVKNVAVGDLMVRAEAEGFIPVTLPVHVELNRTSSYNFELRPLVTYGIIAGSVNDASTGRPLAATIEFPGSNLKTLQTDAATGTFRLENVPAGVYTVTASFEGYFPVTLTVTVPENNVATPTFLLNPTTVSSVVTGQLTDRGDGRPLAGKVVFKNPADGSTVAEVTAEPSTGVYVANIPVGTYAATAMAEGYIPQSAAVSAEKDRTTKQDFALVKPGTKVTLKNIYFDYNKATIRMPQSKEALDAAAKILADNPTIRVEIQGHTDSDGSDAYNQKLSEQRAMSVVSYLVQNYGVVMTRLTAIGYGEAQPVAGNDTPEGKAMNRRVEFVVLGEQ